MRLFVSQRRCSVRKIISGNVISNYVTNLITPEDVQWRAALFLYLNRHGYNGLCRYNRKGGFNVPFGRYKKPYFPEAELWFLLKKHKKPHLFANRLLKHLPCWNRIMWSIVIRHMFLYRQVRVLPAMLLRAFRKMNSVIWSELAWQTAVEKRVPVLISNHATDLTYDLYQHAVLQELQVKRTISRAGHTRQRVAELIARYEPHRLARKAG